VKFQFYHFIVSHCHCGRNHHFPLSICAYGRASNDSPGKLATETHTAQNLTVKPLYRVPREDGNDLKTLLKNLVTEV
jgi:hypothetical protein